ncbi:hypothetical protein AJ79_02085 [Helicocarpus griseus UAMH5409]|uniref:F-box domain-containing protein n=1 Tax=Helicocarpus griseus UAMH5409 TaxID=1447875 RepID=A0A2B7Y4W7_9EURO|nr:hypothetical protein AJ79_02085 [Helicocarpus griseus UAMH5409]
MASPPNGFASSSFGNSLRKPPILSLPPETLSAIFSYASSSDLVNLALVSKSFHDIAAAHLYRSLSHVFAEDDTRTAGQLAVDRLAGILETLTTSDYNYAAFLKEISLDTVHSGDAGERAASEFKYEYSCGKFLNTLFLATIKRIAALESFRWNVRVEISPSVFTALGKQRSLQKLHVRMQAGPSLHSSSATSSSTPQFTPIPPAPVTVSSTTHHHNHHSHHHHHHHHVGPPVPGSMPSYMVQHKSTIGNGDIRPIKRLDVHRVPHAARNFSRFSNLRSLVVLDMDTLDYVSEIAECISSSSTTLKTLKLSFSETLALKARKKTVTDVSDTETAQEDEDDGFTNDPLMTSPPPPPPAAGQSIFGNTNTSTANDADVRRERATQEKALARIFGLEKESAVQKRLEQVAEDAISAADKELQSSLKSSSKNDIDRIFVENLYAIVRNLAKNKGKYASSSKGSKALDKIEKAANKYLERNESADNCPKEKKKTYLTEKGPQKAPSTSKLGAYFTPTISYEFDDIATTTMQHQNMMYPPAPSQAAIPKKGSFPVKKTHTSAASPFISQGLKKTVIHTMKPGKGSSWKSTGPGKIVIDHSSSACTESDSPINKPLPASADSDIPQQSEPVPKTEDKRPEDEFLDVIDIEHPDEDIDEGEDQEFIDPTDGSAEDDVLGPSSGDEARYSEAHGPSYDVEEQSGPSRKGKEPIRGACTISSSSTQPADALDVEMNEDPEDAIHEYIRLHHGIPLETLSIYLIPVKPSVLCRSVNLSVLKHISLLNVGPQRPFWAMLSKLHKTAPLRLTSIHTDNVTPSFLEFLNGLDYLEELFMVERSSRSKVEPFAPKTIVVVDDIRKHVLAKHIKHLKRLMIRNDDDTSWALNKESVKLIGKHGSDLKELVVGLASPNFHLLMQHLSGLRSLHALHILFSQNDYCTSILREIKQCAVDSVIQRPQLKVTYIAVSYALNGPSATTVSRLNRRPRPPGNKKWQIDMHSSDSGPSSSAKGKGKAVEGADSRSFATNETFWAVDDSDDDSDDGRVTVSDGLKIRDVTGVKVWQKEIWDLRL